jgi:hypothetical protein
VARHLGCRINERAFEAELLTGHEDTRACLDPLAESA